MALSGKDAKILWGRAAGRCSKPDCRRELTEPSASGPHHYHFGEHAHMIPDSERGPRGSENDPAVDTDSYENHILLCPICHKMIDKDPGSYPVELLVSWKEQHEKWLLELVGDEMSRVDFDELSRACDAVLVWDGESGDLDLDFTPSEQKMKINRLTTRSRRSIAMGLSQAGVVRDFLGRFEEIEPGYPDKLIAGFKLRYHMAMGEGIGGDELFTYLVTPPSSKIARIAAQVALVSYLFHTCDLFEK